jgi:hypothetical protein
MVHAIYSAASMGMLALGCIRQYSAAKYVRTHVEEESLVAPSCQCQLPLSDHKLDKSRTGMAVSSELSEIVCAVELTLFLMFM